MMSSLSLGLKIAASTITSVTAVATTAFAFGFNPFVSNLSKTTSVFLISESTTVNNTDGITDSTQLNAGDKKNYFCQLGDNASEIDASCIVKELDLTKYTNKIVNASQDIPTKAEDVTVGTTKTEKKHFKVEVKDDFYKKLVATNGSQNLTIQLKSNEKNVKIASLKFLFAKKDNEIFEKTFYSIGKISELKDQAGSPVSPSTSVSISSNTLTCKFPATETGSECDIYHISGTSGIDALNSSSAFTWNSTAASDINKDKFYIFKFKSNGKTFSSFPKNNAGYIIPSSEISVNSSNVKTIVVSDLIPAFYSETSTDTYIFTF